MDGDSTLKSLLVGRLNTVISIIVGILLLAGIKVSADDVANVTNILNSIINSTQGLVSLAILAYGTGSSLYSKYKKR